MEGGGGCLGLGDQGSVYFGTLGIEDSKVLCRAINKLKVKQIARTSVPQHISLTDWVQFFSRDGGISKAEEERASLSSEFQ